jgi:type II secretory pathway component GspD/PulD (secretin)
MLTIIPESEQLVGTSTQLPGFDEFSSGEGLNEVSILLPRVAASTIVTHMIVKTGETAVLGGLLTRTEAEVERGIPGLKAIPIVKWLFTVKEKQSSLQNLVVFMTPRIIFNSEDIAMAIKDAMREYRGKLEKDWKDMFPEDMLPQLPETAEAPAASEEH